MNMIKVTLEDKEFQKLQDELAAMQVKEMQDQKWYPGEIAEIKAKVKARGKWLRDNLID